MAIAGYGVLRSSSRLSLTESVSVYNPKAAIQFVLKNLPESVAQDLDYSSVEFLLECHLDYLRASGIASEGGSDYMAAKAVEENLNTGTNAVADEDEAVDFVLHRARDLGREADPLAVVVVLDLSTQYMVSIGAVGSKADAE